MSEVVKYHNSWMRSALKITETSSRDLVPMNKPVFRFPKRQTSSGVAKDERSKRIHGVCIIHNYTYIYMYVYIYIIYICMYVCMCVCIYIYIYVCMYVCRFEPFLNGVVCLGCEGPWLTPRNISRQPPHPGIPGREGCQSGERLLT